MTDPTQPLHDVDERGFASDNYAGAHPAVLAAIVRANRGHVGSYGADPYTDALQDVVRRHFGEAARAYPAFNGTGANVVSLQSMLPRWGAVICTRDAHVNQDESTAPQAVGGMKLLPVASDDAKLTPGEVERIAQSWRGDVHQARPCAVTLTQSTELGTVYTPAEIRAIADVAHDYGILVHVDGARLANAAAHLGVSLAEACGIGDIAADDGHGHDHVAPGGRGADVVSLGGTKNGALGAEAVVVVDPKAAPHVELLRKLDMQLASKQRFVSAQLVELFGTSLWLDNARHANAMAARLADGIAAIPGCRLPLPVQSNGVFPELPTGVADAVRDDHGIHFYDWNAEWGQVRLLCSWDTTEADVDALVGAIAQECGRA